MSRRPLRWVKFTVFLVLLMPLWSMVLPGLGTAAELLHQPYVESPRPLWPSLLSAAFCLVCALRLVIDAVWDRRLSKAFVAIWVGAAIVTPIAKPHAPSANAPLASDQVALLLEEVQRRLQCELSESGSLPTAEGALQAVVDEILPHTVYRDRLGRPLAPTVRLLVDADGPLRRPRPGDPPATLYVAIARTGVVAWLSASQWGTEGLELLHRSGAPHIASVFPGGTANCGPSLALDDRKPSAPLAPEVLPC